MEINGREARGEVVIAELSRVTKRYGQVTALDRFDLALRRGEVLALLGPNGAGKTTAVQLLLGLSRPSSGTARLFGHDPRDTAARVRIGAMLQVSKVPETLKVREHIELISSYYPRPMAAADLIGLAGLSGLEERPFGKLSGGQRQRVLFALALCGDPDLLFLDEPTTGLDVESRRGLWSAVAELVRGGRTVLLTTHHLEEADALAGRIVLLDRGRLLAEGSPAEIKARVVGRRVRCLTRLQLADLLLLPGVSGGRRDGEETELIVNAAEPVVAELLRRDPGLANLEVRGAGLEEAFLALTGRPDQATDKEAA
ncbi:MAG TPA: ABC transporter ATP-binding protein [Thermoanaerobaculia bacterium]|nr:ABC transporter ATP-binding protein [Thermoanaerobaculia bacterium]